MKKCITYSITSYTLKADYNKWILEPKDRRQLSQSLSLMCRWFIRLDHNRNHHLSYNSENNPVNFHLKLQKVGLFRAYIFTFEYGFLEP